MSTDSLQNLITANEISNNNSIITVVLDFIGVSLSLSSFVRHILLETTNLTHMMKNQSIIGHF